MDKIYEIEDVDESKRTRPRLVIRRLPSQMPITLDMQLMRLGAICHLDGPNLRIAYEFYHATGLQQAEEFLQRCGWRRNS